MTCQDCQRERMQGRMDEIMDRLTSTPDPTGRPLTYEGNHLTTGGYVILFGRTIYFGTHRDSGKRWGFDWHRANAPTA